MPARDQRLLVLSAAVAAALACVLAVVGHPELLAYAAPLLVLALPLVLGRYLGEETLERRATVLGRIELRAGRRWRRDFDVRALRGRNLARLPLRGLEPGGYRVRLTAYDRADNRSRTLVRRFRLR
jgi:hypothetical protein